MCKCFRETVRFIVLAWSFKVVAEFVKSSRMFFSSVDVFILYFRKFCTLRLDNLGIVDAVLLTHRNKWPVVVNT